MATDIASMGDYQIIDIQGERDLQKLLARIKQIDALKIALDSVNTFRENAIKYAKLEAAALVRAVELGGATRLPKHHKKTGLWLAGLTIAQRATYIAMCEDGLTIDQVYKREVGQNEDLAAALNEVRQRSEWLVDDVQDQGMVDMADFNKLARAKLPADVAEPLIDSTRKKLRASGAVGVGDTTYVMVKPENASEILAAIKLRFESARADLNRIVEVAKASKIQVSYRELVPNLSAAALRDPIALNLLIGLFGKGVLDGEDEFMNVIATAQAKNEINESYRGFGKKYNITRSQIIESMYNNMVAEREAQQC